MVVPNCRRANVSALIECTPWIEKGSSLYPACVLVIFLSLVVCHREQWLHISFLPDYSPECFKAIVGVLDVVWVIKFINHKDFAYVGA